jgi:hypothetical protein
VSEILLDFGTHDEEGEEVDRKMLRSGEEGERRLEISPIDAGVGGRDMAEYHEILSERCCMKLIRAP